MDKMYRLKEACTILRISDSTIKRKIKRGIIRAVHVGRPWMVSESELSRIQKDGMN